MSLSENLKLLVARLDQPGAAWDDVEELLEPFPGWILLIRGLRYPVRPMDNRIHWGPVQSEYSQISEVDRIRLLEFFRPFSILLDPDLTVAGRSESLRTAGTDPMTFCKEHKNDAIAEIRESAAEVLAALSESRTLLRWHKRPNAPDQLMRHSHNTGEETLVNSADDAAPVQPNRSNWFKRNIKK